MTATGTNLLGLVKHVATVEARYFGEVFDRRTGVRPEHEQQIDEEARAAYRAKIEQAARPDTRPGQPGLTASVAK